MRLTASRLAAAAAEAAAALLGRPVRRVRERMPDSVILETSGGDLLVSWHPETARVHLSSAETQTAPPSSPFALKLRADVEGTTLLSIAAVPGDRLVEATFERDGGAEGRFFRLLAIEAFGPRSNAFLVDGAGIVVAIARPRSARGREVGSRFEAAPAKPSGAGDAGARAVAQEPAFDPQAQSLEAEAAAHESAEEFERRKTGLARSVRTLVERLASRQDGLNRDLDEALLAPRYRFFGEMLRAYFTRIPKGATEVSLEDYTDPESRLVAIPLDPKVPPAENIRRYFQKAKKGSSGEPVIRKQIAAVGQRLSALEEIAAPLAAATSDENLDAISAGLAAQGVPMPVARTEEPSPRSRPAKSRRVAEKLPYRSFVSADGLPVLVGRGAKENDQLTLRHARGNDLWLHVSGSPGSHVVVRVPAGKSVPLETLLDAAALAVHYSPRRGRGGIEVVYTPAKNIRKPRGAAPGLVTFAAGKSIRSEHEPARLRRLLGTDETAP
jgi:predicted ribosome quality control (RQC) complex YloA/Tae2 family protein